MLRDNLVGLIEPMLSSAGANPLALCTARKKPSDDRPPCLENPRPAGAESTLTENAASPFHAEPKHDHSKAKDLLRMGGVGQYPVHPFQHQNILRRSPHFDQFPAVRLVLYRVARLA